MGYKKTLPSKCPVLILLAMQELEGKVALITGAGRGLGRASAVAMAGEGASVAILCRNSEELMETSTLINNPDVLAIEADVSVEADVLKAVQQTAGRFGSIDILMNNAAIVGPVEHLCEVQASSWDKTFAINLKGALMFSKAALPYLKNSDRGKIINVTSGLGEKARSPLGVYSLTKGALMQMTRVLADELSRFDIDVNGLDPGLMDTLMQEEMRALGPDVLGKELYGEFMDIHESGYLSHPAEVARLAVFLASPHSDGVSGVVGSETDFRPYGFGTA